MVTITIIGNSNLVYAISDSEFDYPVEVVENLEENSLEPVGEEDPSTKMWNLNAQDMDAVKYINGFTDLDDYALKNGFIKEYSMAMNELQDRIGFRNGFITVNGELKTIACNQGATVLDGTFAHKSAFSNFRGIIKGGTYLGGIRNDGQKNNPERTQIIIDAGKTLTVGGIGIVNKYGMIINNGTIDLSTVKEENAQAGPGKPLFNLDWNQSNGHTVENNGTIIFPDWINPAYPATLKMIGTGSYKLGTEGTLRKNDHKPDFSFTKKPEFDIPNNKTGMAIDSIHLQEGVTGASGTCVFEKVSGPDWIQVSSQGTVGGTPAKVGTNEILVVSATDDTKVKKEITITVGDTYESKRKSIDQIQLTSEMGNTVIFDSLISSPKMQSEDIELMYVTNGGGEWWVEESSTWRKITGTEKFETGKKYQLRNSTIVLQKESAYSYEFAGKDAITITVDGLPDVKWTVVESNNPEWGVPYITIDSEPFEVPVVSAEQQGTKEKPWLVSNDTTSRKIYAWLEEDTGTLRFQGMGDMMDIKLYGSAEEIPWKNKKDQIKRVVFPADITYVANYVFQDCAALEEVVLPQNATAIGMAAFQNCTSLKQIQFGNSLQTISDSAFAGCTALETVQLPDGFKQLRDNAFKGCTKLKNIVFPNNTMEYMGQGAFEGCTSLEQIDLGAVSFISHGTFKGCTGLKELYIPKSLWQIDDSAFEDCTGLEKVYIEGMALGTLDANVFKNVGNSTQKPVLQLREDWDTQGSGRIMPAKAGEYWTWYGGTFQYEPILKPVLEEIYFQAYPTRMVYKEGETFEANGMEIFARYKDGIVSNITTQCTVTDPGSLTKTNNEVKVSYTEDTVTKNLILKLHVSEEFSVVLDNIDWTYTGTAIKPKVTVVDELLGKQLGKNQYQVFYANNRFANYDTVSDITKCRYITKETVVLKQKNIDAFLAAHDAEWGAFDPKLPYIVVQGKNGYAGTMFLNFNINPISLFKGDKTPAENVTVSINETIEVGKSAAILTAVKINGKALKFGTDYVFSIKNDSTLEAQEYTSGSTKYIPKTANSYTLQITGKGGYTGVGEFTFYADAKSKLLSNTKIAIGENVKKVDYHTGNSLYKKNGTKWEFADASSLFAKDAEEAKNKKADMISVVLEGKYLTTADFDVSYRSNEAVGTATVLLKAKATSAYVGIKSFTFQITGTPLKASDLKINGEDKLPNRVYDSKAQTLEYIFGTMPTFTYQGKTLDSSAVSVSYSNHINKGKATVTFAGKPEMGYTGSVKKTFNITACPLQKSMTDSETAYKGKTATFTKMGSAIDSKICLRMDNGYILKLGTDYTLKYSNHKDGQKLVEGGKVIIQGIGNFSGALGEYSFGIKNQNLATGFNTGIIGVSVSPIAYKAGKADKTYKPQISVYDGTSKLKIGTDIEVTAYHYDNGSIAKYLDDPIGYAGFRPYVEITGLGKGYEGTLHFYVPIKEVSQHVAFTERDTKLSLKLDPITYSGTVSYPLVTIKYNDTVLVKGKDYTLVYGRTITGKGSVTICGLGKYYGSIKKTFQVDGRYLK